MRLRTCPGGVNVSTFLYVTASLSYYKDTGKHNDV